MQAYRRTNIVLLAASIAAITIPAIILPLQAAAPQVFPTCYSILILNRPCPMCGLTRGIGCIAWGRFSDAVDYNMLSFVFFSILISEAVFRTYVLCARPGAEKMPLIRKYDFRVHMLFVSLYMIYALWFHASISLGL